MAVNLNLEPIIQSNEVIKGYSKYARVLYSKLAKQEKSDILISPGPLALSLTEMAKMSDYSKQDYIKRTFQLCCNQCDKIKFSLDLMYKKSFRHLKYSMINYTYLKCERKNLTVPILTMKFPMDVKDNTEIYENEQMYKAHKTKSLRKIQEYVYFKEIWTPYGTIQLNSNYLKGVWLHKFDKKCTRNGPFYIDDKNTVTVDYMWNTESKIYRYAELNDIDAKVLELPYAKSKLSFIIVLPNKRNGLQKLENILKNHEFSKIMEQLRYESVLAVVPKFKLEYSTDLLEDLLKFAEFDDYIHKADTCFEKFLKFFIHSTYFEINEDGVRNKKKTDVFDTKCADVKKDKKQTPVGIPKYFVADHSFVFHVVETITNNVLISGRCKDFKRISDLLIYGETIEEKLFKEEFKTWINH